MGFSLAGFGAGLAESVVSRIEEERKFSAAALQGRIERASIMKEQREKEQKALTEELRNRKNELMTMGVQDNDLQIAYLSAPMAFEALKKAQGSGLNIDPRTLININKEKLFAGTADEFIAKAAGATERVEPAKILPSEGRSMLAPSEFQEQRRFEQLASMRGMSLEDVARAEGGPRARMPEPAASINYKTLQKPEKEDVDVKLKTLLKNAADANELYGAKDQRTLDAKARYNSYQSYVSSLKSMNPDQQKHSELLQRYLAIRYDPTRAASEEERKIANQYIENYNRDKQLDKANDKMPTESVMSTGMGARAATAIVLKYGDRIGKGFAETEVNTPEGRYIDLKVTDANPELRAEVIRTRQLAAFTHPEVIAEFTKNKNTIKNNSIKNALSRFGIDFSADGKPILTGGFEIALSEKGKPIVVKGEDSGEVPKPTQAPSTSTVSTPNRMPSSTQRAPVPPVAATATPVSTPGPGRAGQGGASTAASSASVIADARDAISKGADRNAVIKRLRDMGITPPGDL